MKQLDQRILRTNLASITCNAEELAESESTRLKRIHDELPYLNAKLSL
jgi:hypothetical protein